MKVWCSSFGDLKTDAFGPSFLLLEGFCRAWSVRLNGWDVPPDTNSP